MLNVIRFVLETTLFNKSVIEGFKTLWHCFVTMFNCVISMASWILLYLYFRPLQSQMFAPFCETYFREICFRNMLCDQYWVICVLFQFRVLIHIQNIWRIRYYTPKASIRVGSIATMVPSYSATFDCMSI